MIRLLGALALLAGTAGAQTLSRPALGAPSFPALSVPSISVPIGAPALTPALAVPSLGVPSLPVTPVPAALSPVRVAPSAPEFASPVPTFILAHVFDLDGNVFGPGFPTKIILFKKGTNEELAVPTAHFAVIEKKIGTDFVYGGANLFEYELRGAASFREFFGDQFAKDLKYAVENLPVSEWQGPSWAAMVRALSDPSMAANFYVLTARQHSSEQLLDGFRYLQAAGYIKYLPKVENLHGVGGTYRTAERKAELMVQFLDSMQAAPPAADGGLHTIGFSDDTWENYEKMRDALAAVLAREPGRWSRVKIVLFFTGSNTVLHRAEAIVVNADGSTRPYIANEPR